jgi:hypothetical protein
MAGASAERQETGIVNAVKLAVEKNKKNPITLIVGKTTVEGVVEAKKYDGRQLSGSEPYTDIVLVLHDGKHLNLSCKGPSAPSLAGGGLSGLELIVPGITSKFMNSAYSYLTKTLKMKPGDKIPDVYGEITGKNKERIVVGTKAMGGEIDYMFIGVMDVSTHYDETKNTLQFRNTELTESKQYANSHRLFFRLRARREDQRFDPLAKDKNGTPKIYGKSPSKGDSAGRIVIVDKVPTNAIIIKL